MKQMNNNMVNISILQLVGNHFNEKQARILVALICSLKGKENIVLNFKGVNILDLDSLDYMFEYFKKNNLTLHHNIFLENSSKSFENKFNKLLGDLKKC